MGYSLAENNKTLKKTKLENKLLRTRMSALKSNYRIKKIAESNGMVFPRKKDIKSVSFFESIIFVKSYFLFFNKIRL